MFSYTPMRRDPVSRVRALTGDMVEDGARWSDDDILLALAETEVKSFFWLQYDRTTDPVATAATAEIRVGAGSLELVLVVTTGPYAGTKTFDLCGDDRYDEVEELFQAIRDTPAAFTVGLETNGGRITWLSPSVTSWPGRLSSDTDVRAALDTPSMDLALTNGPIDVFSSIRRLSIYRHKAAARRLLQSALLLEAESRSEGNVSISYGNLETRLKLLYTPVAVGVNL